ncbi:MAG: hypothetical protein VYA54_10515 [Bdellovibrionota bacterium]|nr:hypothetical protein [Bdellovibrionota bacterium]
MKYLLCILLLSSCSLFKTKKLSSELDQSLQNICLSSRGKGRLQVGNSKYVFSYESVLDKEQARWMLALNFPLRPQESFTLDWSENGKTKLETSLEDKILKENKGVSPASVETFIQGLGGMIQEIIAIRDQRIALAKRDFQWKKDRNELKTINSAKNLKGEFKKLDPQGHFGLMQLSYLEAKKSFYKLDLVVRKCFEKN